jgi:hypothetical protein
MVEQHIPIHLYQCSHGIEHIIVQILRRHSAEGIDYRREEKSDLNEHIPYLVKIAVIDIKSCQD